MFVRLAMLMGLLLTPAFAAAEPGHGHSHRGGQEVRIGGIYEVELVVAGSEMILHVNDTKDQKVNAAGFSATAVVLAKGNQQRTVELAHAGENRLVGKIDFATETRFRATVTGRPLRETHASSSTRKRWAAVSWGMDSGTVPSGRTHASSRGRTR